MFISLLSKLFTLEIHRFNLFIEKCANSFFQLPVRLIIHIAVRNSKNTYFFAKNNILSIFNEHTIRIHYLFIPWFKAFKVYRFIHSSEVFIFIAWVVLWPI